MRRFLRWFLPGVLLVAFMTTTFGTPGAQQNLLQQNLFNLRLDLEVLADLVYGGFRPDGWQGTADFASDTMLADLYVDNELLADEIYGVGLRPRDWISATTINRELVARNLRHDLELSATAFFDDPDFRPDNWIGGPALLRCSRSLMNVVFVLETEYGLRTTTPETVFDYCSSVAAEVEETLIPQAIGTMSVVTEADAPELILAVRGDLERTADEFFGVNVRPDGWIDNIDITSPTLAQDIRTDLAVLADEALGIGQRPRLWNGSTPSGTNLASFRSLRFDLELITDVALGTGNRPRGWQGDSLLTRCEPIIQSLVNIANATYDEFTIPAIDATGFDYCTALAQQTNNFVENPPIEIIEVDGTLTPDEIEGSARFLAESRFAFSYLDVAATQYMGTMPGGIEFRAIYRNFNESNMMFVSGDNFALFIDRRFTTLDRNTFEGLPTLEGVQPLAFCDTNWCNGPGPTPTPTGVGAVAAILSGATPPPAPPGEATPSGDDTEKIIVNWDHIRVNYIQQREAQMRAQVTLEICAEPNGVLCEPVLVVQNTATGQIVPSLSQFNGLNVYELPYGYSTNFRIEGATYISNDIWLNDPALTGGGG